jgi:hypothetical protein
VGGAPADPHLPGRTAEPNPIFYDGREYQGAKGPVYPYALLDRLLDRREERTWRALWLENEYLRLSVLPEIGGRIFTALDQDKRLRLLLPPKRVIKPSLIGMLGAWISGGVEWNFPHHHRSRTFMPMDYQLVENPDGSRTLWLGELERRHRMRLDVLAMTVHPDRSYVEVTRSKIFNRTPVVNSFLCFSPTPPSTSTRNYQVLFPPDTQWTSRSTPRTNSPGGPSPTSATAAATTTTSTSVGGRTSPSRFRSSPTELRDADFFAGYDHGKQAGVVLRRQSPYRPRQKILHLGLRPEQGKMWDKMLTDTDGPYLELMAGAYSDNQPDYSWAQPGTKSRSSSSTGSPSAK